MRTLLAGLVLLSAAAGFQGGAPDNIDPVGKWTVSTRDENGDPAAATMEIAGAPGAYVGKLVSTQGREVSIVDVLTSPKSVVIVADLPEGGVAVIRGVRSPSGGITGTWGPLRRVIPVTIERAR